MPIAEPESVAGTQVTTPLTDRQKRRLRITAADKLIGAARLIHPFPVTVVVVTSGVLLELAHHGGLNLVTLTRGCATVLCSQVAVGAYNDYVDRENDARVQPQKPIPSGAASPRTARALVLLGLLGGTVLSASFGPGSLLLVLAGTGAGMTYDRWLKRKPYSVAGYIAGFLLLITWIWAVAGRLSAGFLVLYPAGALLVTAAHLAQSLPDIESDSAVGARGLAVELGVRGSVSVIISCVAILAGGAAVLSVVAGPPVLAAAPLVGFAFAAVTVARLRAQGYALSARETAFRALGPALALLAVSASVACIRLGII